MQKESERKTCERLKHSSGRSNSGNETEMRQLPGALSACYGDVSAGTVSLYAAVPRAGFVLPVTDFAKAGKLPAIYVHRLHRTGS